MSKRNTSFLGAERHSTGSQFPQIEGLNMSSRQLNTDIAFNRLGISKIEFKKLPPEGRALYLMAATTFVVAGVLPGFQGGVDINPGFHNASDDKDYGGDVFSLGNLDHNDQAALSGISLVLDAYEKVDPLIANTHQIEVVTAAKVMRIKTNETLDGGISQLAQLKNDVDTEKGVPLSQRLLDVYLMANHFYKMKDGSYAHIGFTKDGSMAVNKGFTLEQARSEATLPKFIERVKDAASVGFWQDPPIAPSDTDLPSEPTQEVLSVVPADRVVPIAENFGDPVLQGEIVRVEGSLGDDAQDLQVAITEAGNLFNENYANGREVSVIGFTLEDAFGNDQHVVTAWVHDSAGALASPTPDAAPTPIPLSEPSVVYYYVEANNLGMLVPPGSGLPEAGGAWIPLRMLAMDASTSQFVISIPSGVDEEGRPGEVHIPVFEFKITEDGELEFTIHDPFTGQAFSTTNPEENPFFANQSASLDTLVGLKRDNFRVNDENGGAVQVFEKGKWVDMSTKIPDTIWGKKAEDVTIVLKDGVPVLQMELTNFQTPEGSSIAEFLYNQETKSWDIAPNLTLLRTLPLVDPELYNRNYHFDKLSDLNARVDLFFSNGAILGVRTTQDGLDFLTLYKGNLTWVTPAQVGVSTLEGTSRQIKYFDQKGFDVAWVMEVLKSADLNNYDAEDRFAAYMYFFHLQPGATADSCNKPLFETQIALGSRFVNWCKEELAKGTNRPHPNKDNVDFIIRGGNDVPDVNAEFDPSMLPELQENAETLTSVDGTYFVLNFIEQ